MKKIKSVTLKITSKCNLHCDFCYESSQKNNDLKYKELTFIIDNLCKASVDLILISGGEPLIRSDISKIVEYCNARGIIVRIATNGRLISEKLLSDLNSAGVDKIFISVGDMSDLKQLDLVDEKIKLFKNLQIESKLGINVITTKSFVKNISAMYKWIIKRTSSVFLINPRPSRNNDLWYKKNMINRNDIIVLFQYYLINQINIRFYTDCSFNDLNSMIEYYKRKQVQIHKNNKNEETFIAQILIDASGNVYPCSRRVEEENLCGSILEESVQEMIKKDVLKHNKIYCNGKSKPYCLRGEGNEK